MSALYSCEGSEEQWIIIEVCLNYHSLTIQTVTCTQRKGMLKRSPLKKKAPLTFY